jgi:hypothetical protein
MRWQAVTAPLLVASLGAAIAGGQPVSRPDAGRPRMFSSPTPVPVADAGAPPPAAPVVEADPCDAVIRAVRFERVDEAERAWRACRAMKAPPGRVPLEDDLRALEGATEALHGLRRPDGNFCVAPSAPFDLTGPLGGARDSRRCFVALDRLLRSEESVLRFLLDDGYAAGRLAARSRANVVALRRDPRRAVEGSAVEQEQVALARLLGRHFMRTCRCMSGPQPVAMTAVRAMRLPRMVETVLLRGIAERTGEDGP